MLANLTSLSHRADYQAGTQDLPLLNELANRYADERPFANLRVVSGHILVFNSLAALRVLEIGGAEVVLCDPFSSPFTRKITEQLEESGLRVLPVAEAVHRGDLFLDVAAVLGQLRLPQGAAELTRSGEYFYQHQSCVTVTVDSTQVKKIECFFGIGDGMVRAWQMMKPNQSLARLRVAQFGYGKVGRGVAHRLRREEAEVTIVELPGPNRDQAIAEGFDLVLAQSDPRLESLIGMVDVVVAVTGIANAVARSIDKEWLDRSKPTLVSMGAVDEFGEAIPSERILGGKGKPLNFHLASPTANRYVDPSLAAHVLALEEVVQQGATLGTGLHPLNPDVDEWLLSQWQKYWPTEDLQLAFAV